MIVTAKPAAAATDQPRQRGPIRRVAPGLGANRERPRPADDGRRLVARELGSLWVQRSLLAAGECARVGANMRYLGANLTRAWMIKQPTRDCLERAPPYCPGLGEEIVFMCNAVGPRMMIGSPVLDDCLVLESRSRERRSSVALSR